MEKYEKMKRSEKVFYLVWATMIMVLLAIVVVVYILPNYQGTKGENFAIVVVICSVIGLSMVLKHDCS